MKDIINKIVEKQLEYVLTNSCVLAGNNGPYRCSDTPVRNCAHWICIFKYFYTMNKDDKYLKAIELLADHILLGKYYGSSGAVLCMTDDKMDHLNGSIGQAWAIEGLIAAYYVTHNKRFYDNAVKIFLSQKYDFNSHLWDRVEVDGKNLGPDKVFNHELWFAASGFLILKAKNNREIYSQVDDFMKNIDSIYGVYNDGLFKHYISGYEKNNNFLKSYIKKNFGFLSFLNPKFDERYFEKAYHLFDLYGFAIIYNCKNDYSVFCSEKFNKALNYGLNILKLDRYFNIDNFLKKPLSKIVKYNKYSYSYNSPAFEFPYIDFTFNNGNNSFIYDKMFEKQVEFSFDSENLVFSKNTDDALTLTARLYEYIKYLEMVDCEKK